MKEYISAKARLVQYQKPASAALLGRDDTQAWKLRGEVKGQLYSFGFSPLPKDCNGMTYTNGSYTWHDGSTTTDLPIGEVLELRGEHNKLNAMAAASLALLVGLTPQNVIEGIRGFKGVAHRMEIIAQHDGITWINDSIATAPERTIAAVQSFDGPLMLMLGGRDKKLPWGELSKLIHKRVGKVVLFGEAAALIQKALLADPAAGTPESILKNTVKTVNLREAVQAAVKLAETGDTVLFSPGGTSYDEFKDFAERGEKLKLWLSEQFEQK